MITAREITFGYVRTTPVLTDVTVLADHGVIGLVGPNGSGKTTLLRTMYAALKPTAGLVSLDDEDVRQLKAAELAKRIAVVPQESASDLPITVADMVLLGRAPRRSMLQAFTREDHRLAAAALSRVSARDLADRSYSTLSGGEKQRVLIARALAQEADHLLLDEPTNHLDLRHQHELLALVRALGTTTVVVLHDLNLAARYCDRVVLLDGGVIVAQGTPREVLTRAVLEPVYQISVQVLEDRDCVQLFFRPTTPDDAHRDRALSATRGKA